MIADAEACGRVVRSVSQPGHRKSRPTTAPIDTSEGRPNAEIATGEDHTVMDHLGSPVHGIPHAGEGIDNTATERGNEAPNPVRATPSGHRSGKEPFHDEIQQPRECALGLQGSVKRKSMRTVVVSSTSTEGSDPEGGARKLRRLNRSPSPILLKERVSFILVLLNAAMSKYHSVRLLERVSLNMQRLKSIPCKIPKCR